MPECESHARAPFCQILFLLDRNRATLFTHTIKPAPLQCHDRIVHQVLPAPRPEDRIGVLVANTQYMSELAAIVGSTF